MARSPGSNRFPRFRPVVVPLLWLQAALCASAVVAAGPFQVLPWVGIAALGLQALVFFWLSLRSEDGIQQEIEQDSVKP